MNFGYSVGRSDGPGWIAVGLVISIALLAFFVAIAPTMLATGGY